MEYQDYSPDSIEESKVLHVCWQFLCCRPVKVVKQRNDVQTRLHCRRNLLQDKNVASKKTTVKSAPEPREVQKKKKEIVDKVINLNLFCDVISVQTFHSFLQYN